MPRFHLLEKKIPLFNAPKVIANCGEPVLNPFTITIEVDGDLRRQSSLGSICGACKARRFTGRHYRYAVMDGQEAILAGFAQ